MLVTMLQSGPVRPTLAASASPTASNSIFSLAVFLCLRVLGLCISSVHFRVWLWVPPSSQGTLDSSSLRHKRLGCPPPGAPIFGTIAGPQNHPIRAPDSSLTDLETANRAGPEGGGHSTVAEVGLNGGGREKGNKKRGDRIGGAGPGRG